MLLSPHRSRRRGAVLAEAGLVYPIVFFIVVCVVVIGVGVFRFQQTALLAREGARWASVRGPQYASPVASGGTGNTVAAGTDVSTYVKSVATGLNTNTPPLTITTSWIVNGTSQSTPPTTVSTTNKTQVVVRVDYVWTPEIQVVWLPSGALTIPSITLTSTAQMAQSY